MNYQRAQQKSGAGQGRPGCVGVEEAATILGWPAYFLPLLVSAGHLKPLGRPTQNARKWFAAVELERLCQDTAWLDKAVRIVEKHVQEKNKRQRGRNSTPANLPAMADMPAMPQA